MNKVGDKIRLKGTKYIKTICLITGGFLTDELCWDKNDICYSNHEFINLSAQGRKAAASTAKKVRRGKDGRYQKKSTELEYQLKSALQKQGVRVIDWEKIKEKLQEYLWGSTNILQPFERNMVNEIVSILKENI